MTSADTNPADPTLPSHAVEWIVMLFAIPLPTAAAGFVAWRAKSR